MATLQSWVKYTPETDFPIQNLPYGVFSRLSDTSETQTRRIGVAIGDYVLDLYEIVQLGHLPYQELTHSTLNAFMNLGKAAWSNTRQILQSLLSTNDTVIQGHDDVISRVLILQSDVRMHLPAQIGDYTDFYASKNHAYNVGVMFRGPDNALQPNWTWLPVGYHGRASSVVVSGTNLRRPAGQLSGVAPTDPIVHDACKTLDFELELGYFVGQGNNLGEPITIDNANQHLFGVVLLNDWSARDIQKWEYVPLGPFGAKNFGTTISPWVVTFEALEPFIVDGPKQDPPPLPYLDNGNAPNTKMHNIALEIYMKTQTNNKETLIATSNAKYLYWTPQQMLTHHTVTGCNMNAGDLLGSGTISGPTEAEYGSLLELSWKGTKTIPLADGETRKFIQDYDTVIMRGKAKGDGYTIGFGDCAGQILPNTSVKK